MTMSDAKVRFGKWEAITVLINLISTKVFLNVSRVTAETAGTASWILAIYVSFLSLILFYIISKLYSKFEGKDLLDISEYVGGKIGKIICGTIIIFLLLYIVPVVLREFAEDMKVISFITTPISIVTMFFLICMMISAYFGLETIVRVHAAVVPIIIIGFLLIICGALPYANIKYALPILGQGVYNIFGEGFFSISIFGELLILFLIAPYIGNNKTLKKVGYTAIGFSTFFLTISSLVVILVTPYPSVIESFLPIYQISRLISYSRFFQRIESIFIIIWVFAALLYLSVLFYYILFTFKKMFGLKYYKPLILPFAVLIFNISLLPPNLLSAINLETNYFRRITWTAAFFLIIILLLTAKFINKKRLCNEEKP